jgi:DUF1009 family protein
MEPIGVVAGSGDLPGRLIAALRGQGRATVVIALKDHADPTVLQGPDAHWFRIGEAGSAIKVLRDAGCRDLVMAGAVRRPGMLQLMPDAATAAFFAKLGFKALGDDGLLRAVIQHLETVYGFRVRAVEDVCPGLLGAPVGPLGRCVPDEAAWVDIHRGMAVLAALAPVDVGQAVVVQQGLVLGVEAIEGTDRLLARVGAFARPGAGGVLVKLAKPGQETRADRPTLGPATVEGAVAAGLRGIAFDAVGALLVDREAMIAQADAAELFLLALDPTNTGGNTR